MKFSLYKHSLILGDNRIVTKQFIVLKHTDSSLQFTNFHRYVKTSSKIKSISDDGNKRFSYVTKFLNYVFGEIKITSLDYLTLDMVREFLMHYGLGTLLGDTKHRKKSTVEICVNTVLDFLTLYLDERKGKALLTSKELYTTTSFTNKRGRLIKRKEPSFEVFYDDSNTEQVIFRDMPNAAFEMLFAHIAKNHKDLLMVVALGAFVGLRPSEACNV
ncbi:site-specific integrase, partial [Streptococcus orisratti]